MKFLLLWLWFLLSLINFVSQPEITNRIENNIVSIFYSLLIDVCNKSSELSRYLNTQIAAKPMVNNINFLGGKINKYFIRTLLNFQLYENENWFLEDNNSEQLGVLMENHNLTDPKFKRLFNKMCNETFKIYSDINLEKIIGEYYFSIYTQKILILQFLVLFINNESPKTLHSMVNALEFNYPENYIIYWLYFLLIISYKESLSPLAYQSDFDTINEILFLIKKLDQSSPFFLELQSIKRAVQLIYCKKEIYKYITLLENGSMGVGFNGFKKYLKEYEKCLFKPLHKYSIPSYVQNYKLRNYLRQFQFFNYKKEFLWAWELKTQGKKMQTINYGYPMIPMAMKDQLINMEIITDSIKQSEDYQWFLKYKKFYKQLKAMM